MSMTKLQKLAKKWIDIDQTMPRQRCNNSGRVWQSKEDKWDTNDSSSLTAISDDKDSLRCTPLSATSTPKSAVEGLEFGAHKSALTSRPPLPPSECYNAELDELILDTVRAKPEWDLVQLPDTKEVKASHAAYNCNAECSREISDLKAWIQKLEDLVFPPYQIPPPSVASVLEEYKRL
ncbi:hypothetical protein DFH28DRAFT_936427 [Melampsora americana]|nr:hypothetical protein DFH28DRAFT_936427 [Melampsora americana]